MTYRFSRENFNKNADIGIKKILSRHLDYINGLEVSFEDEDGWGTVEGYNIENQKYYLYPVLKEWCIIEEQLRLI